MANWGEQFGGTLSQPVNTNIMSSSGQLNNATTEEKIANWQKTSNTFRDWGAGFIPDILAGLYESGQLLKGGLRNFDKAGIQSLETKNPFKTQEQFKRAEQEKFLGIPGTQGWGETGRDIAGGTAWLTPAKIPFAGAVTPIGKATQFVAGRAIPGFVSASLGKASQEGVTPQEVIKAGKTGALVNTALGLVEKGVKATGKFLLKKIPEDINRVVVDEPYAKSEITYQKGLDTLVGSKNKQFALDEGIINPVDTFLSDETIAQTKQAVIDKLTGYEDELQKVLEKGGKVAPYGETVGVLKQMLKDAPPVPGVDKEKYIEEVSKWFNEQLVKNEPNLNKIISGEAGITLSTLNELKRAIGEKYGDRTFDEMYSFLRQYIEDKAKDKAVSQINQKLGKLIEINSVVNKVNKPAYQIPYNLTEEGISEAFEKNRQAIPGSLEGAIRSSSIPITALTGKNLLGRLGQGNMGLASGAVVGPWFVSNTAINYLKSNPELQLKIATVLGTTGEKVLKIAENKAGRLLLEGLEKTIIQSNK